MHTVQNVNSIYVHMYKIFEFLLNPTDPRYIKHIARELDSGNNVIAI